MRVIGLSQHKDEDSLELSSTLLQDKFGLTNIMCCQNFIASFHPLLLCLFIIILFPPI